MEQHLGGGGGDVSAQPHGERRAAYYAAGAELDDAALRFELAEKALHDQLKWLVKTGVCAGRERGGGGGRCAAK